MKKSVLIILPLILILSFAFVSAKDSFSEKNKVEDLKQSLLDSGKFENEEDFLGVEDLIVIRLNLKKLILKYQILNIETKQIAIF